MLPGCAWRYLLRLKPLSQIPLGLSEKGSLFRFSSHVLWNKSKTYKMAINNIYTYILIVQSEYTLKVVANCNPRLTPREIFQHLAPQLTFLVQINVFSIIKEPPKGASILITIKYHN